MAIDFTVENNTGLSTATSYISVADFKQYWENRGVLLIDVDGVYEVWLNEATYFIGNNFDFCGEPVNDTQALSFPNSLYSEVPKQVKNAQCEIAYSRQANPSLTFKENGIKSKRIGPVNISYESMNASEIKKQYTVAYQQLRKICQLKTGYIERC